MKRHLRCLFTLLSMLLVPAAMRAQETFTIFSLNPDDWNYDIPIPGDWADSYTKTEFIVPGTYLTGDGFFGSDITDMTFYGINGNENVSWPGTHFKVFLKEVNNQVLSSFTGYNDATVVYEGSLSVVNGQMKIIFTTPFVYHGGNLLIGVYNTSSQGTANTIGWRGEHVWDNAAVVGVRYFNESFNNLEAEPDNFIPMVTFGYTPNVITCPAPTGLDITINGTSATMTWDDNPDAVDWQINIGGYWVNFIVATEPHYTFTGLIPNESYYINIRTNCGGGYTSNWSGLFITIPGDCTPPSNLNADNITFTSAKVSWNGCGLLHDETFELRYP